MIDRRRLLPPLLLAAVLAGSARGEVPPPAGVPGLSADDVPFVSRVSGLKFLPPAGGTIQRQLNSGEIVRYSYPALGWTLTVKENPNSAHLPLTGNPRAARQPGAVVPADGQGLLELSAAQLTDRGGKPAQILFQDVVPVGRPVGLIKALDNAGNNRLFVQTALIVNGIGRYYVLQLVAPAAAQPAAEAAFQQTLASVELLDRAAFKQEQRRRLDNTRGLWVLIDRRKIESVLQPVHFLRVVRDGRDIGYVQVDERVDTLNGRPGAYVDVREHLVTGAPAAAGPAPGGPGLNVPRPAAAGPAVAAAPTQLDREAKSFVTFDRDHESWSTQTRLNDRPGHDSMELGGSDVEAHPKLVPAAHLMLGRPTTEPDKRPGRDVLLVDDYVGATRSAPTFRTRVDHDVSYLPQAIAQLLPRLVPVDEPEQYMFSFYVSEQRDTLARYVDVGRQRAVTLDGRTVQAVPVADRVGADGVVTTHYVDPVDGQWLGTVSDDGRLEVLPTDADTLRKAWPTFAELPPPGPLVVDEPVNPIKPLDRPRVLPGDLMPPKVDGSAPAGR